MRFYRFQLSPLFASRTQRLPGPLNVVVAHGIDLFRATPHDMATARVRADVHCAQQRRAKEHKVANLEFEVLRFE